MEVLRIEGLNKYFGGVHALRGIELVISKGERRAIIGPNGAGKTTLFKVVLGELRPSSGQIYILGHNVTLMPTYKRIRLGVARTFQVNSLFPHLSVMDNLILALQAARGYGFKMFRSAESYPELFLEADMLLQKWDLKKKAASSVHTLSAGEQRCLELALGLASKPRLVMLDEPTASLSQQETRSFISLLQNFDKEITLLIIEHDMDVVSQVAEHITVLHNGSILANGTKDEIKSSTTVKAVYTGL